MHGGADKTLSNCSRMHNDPRLRGGNGGLPRVVFAVILILCGFFLSRCHGQPAPTLTIRRQHATNGEAIVSVTVSNGTFRFTALSGDYLRISCLTGATNFIYSLQYREALNGAPPVRRDTNQYGMVGQLFPNPAWLPWQTLPESKRGSNNVQSWTVPLGSGLRAYRVAVTTNGVIVN